MNQLSNQSGFKDSSIRYTMKGYRMKALMAWLGMKGSHFDSRIAGLAWVQDTSMWHTRTGSLLVFL